MTAFLLIFLSLCGSVPVPVATDFGANDHAIYISVVEVNHDVSSQNAIVKIKVFSNDFEDAIMNAFHKRIDVSNLSVCETNQPLIENYFSGHFTFSIDASKSKLRFNRCELNGDAIWFYFDMQCPSFWKEINVKADYLMELFPTQSNVISIYHGDEKRFIRLTEVNTSGSIKF